jgi:hypothetical protein
MDDGTFGLKLSTHAAPGARTYRYWVAEHVGFTYFIPISGCFPALLHARELSTDRAVAGEVIGSGICEVHGFRFSSDGFSKAVDGNDMG